MSSRPPLLRRVSEVDIPRLIAELEAQHSRNSIAFALAVAESTLRRWETGSAPNFEDGRALCQLYEETLRRRPPVRIEPRLEIANTFA